MSTVKNIIFDLDGTLIDSAPTLVQILNEMLEARGSSRHINLATIRPFASLGGAGLVSGVLAQECGDLAQEVADFRARYALQTTHPDCLYEGVAEGVRELAAQGYRLAICSNKPQLLCEKVIADLGLDPYFTVVVGSSPGHREKPAPDLLELVLSQLGAVRSECLYVGDSEVDHALASATGVRFILVSYGYANRQFSAENIERFSKFPELVRSLSLEQSKFFQASDAAQKG